MGPGILAAGPQATLSSKDVDAFSSSDFEDFLLFFVLFGCPFLYSFKCTLDARILFNTNGKTIKSPHGKDSN